MDTPLEQWPARLEEALAQCRTLRTVKVLRETGSTQDAATQLHAERGDVIVAGRQVMGRGRLGRQWVDTRGDGLALTAVVDASPPERLAIACAVATAIAVESLLGRAIGIKWPNDIVVAADAAQRTGEHAWRKLAGVLIEQRDGKALIGIGINVRQGSWPAELSGSAVSLLQLGADVDRLDVAAALLPVLDDAIHRPDAWLCEQFGRRDALRQCIATFRFNNKLLTGRIVEIDPLRGLVVQAGAATVRLPAATTTIVSIEAVDAGTSKSPLPHGEEQADGH